MTIFFLRFIAIVGLLSPTTLSISDRHPTGSSVISEDLEQAPAVRETARSTIFPVGCSPDWLACTVCACLSSR
jgi:hypothetical protein